MDIVLRKIGGKLTPVLRSRTGPSFGSGPGPSAVLSFLFSPLAMLIVVAFFLAAAFLSLHPATAHALPLHHAPMAFVAGETARELLDKRATLATRLRELTDRAESEKRALNAEEDVEYNKVFGEVKALRSRIDRMEELRELERDLAEKRSKEDPAPLPGAPTPVASARGTPEYQRAFGSFIQRGLGGMKPEDQRALSIGSDTGGGFTAAPDQFVAGLIKTLDNTLWIRKMATVIQVPTAVSLGMMTLDTDPDDADWTSELAVGNEDAAMAVGRRKLTPHPLAKLIKASNDFLRQTMTGGETLIRERLAYKFGVAQEKGFMTGTGVQQALGIYTASADGIPTSRDVSTGNTTTSLTWDGLTSAKYALKEGYRGDPALRWNFHTDAVSQVAKLKDGNGQYLWRESVRVGEPDRILNIGLTESVYAPNTFTTGQYVGMLGLFRYYTIADAYDLAIQRLDQLFALTNQMGFIGRQAVDGQATLAEAFVRVKLA